MNQERALKVVLVLGGLLFSALIGGANAQDPDSQYLAEADREYAALFSHVENPCPNESTTLSYNLCIGREVEFTQKHLNAFLAAVRGIVTSEEGTASALETAGKVNELDLLNNADRAWQEYKKNLCKLEFAGFYGGSGASSAESECEYRTNRHYVQQVADAVSTCDTGTRHVERTLETV